VRSSPDGLGSAVPSRRAFLTLSLGWVVGTSFLGAGDVGADESRFRPWNGAPTPPLALRDLSGRPHTLADYRGKVVVLDFWATWCDFCKDEIASLTKLQERLAGSPLAILWVNYGQSPVRVREYVEQLSADVRVLLDPDQDAARAWQVHMIPSSFLVDAEGRVRYRVIGNMDWGGEDAVRTVRAVALRSRCRAGQSVEPGAASCSMRRLSASGTGQRQ
jgi:thiol-disulfide isomerase/thioredoxin